MAPTKSVCLYCSFNVQELYSYFARRIYQCRIKTTFYRVPRDSLAANSALWAALYVISDQ